MDSIAAHLIEVGVADPIGTLLMQRVPRPVHRIIHRFAGNHMQNNRPTLSDALSRPTKRFLLGASLDARAQALRHKVEALAHAAGPAESGDVAVKTMLVKQLSEGQRKMFSLERELRLAQERIKALSEENATLRQGLIPDPCETKWTTHNPSPVTSAMSTPPLTFAAALGNEQAAVPAPRRAFKRRASVDGAEVLLALRESLRRSDDPSKRPCPPRPERMAGLPPKEASTTIVKTLASLRHDGRGHLSPSPTSPTYSLPPNMSYTSLCSLGGLSDGTCDAEAEGLGENLPRASASAHTMATGSR